MEAILSHDNKTIFLALIFSISIHCVLFIFSGRTFITHPQFSVQSSNQRLEISIKEIKEEVGESSLTTIQGKAMTSLKVDKDHKKFLVSKELLSRSGVISEANPNYFQNLAPEYPELAKEMHQEGIVMLSVDVDRKGDPLSVVIVQSSGFRMLDLAALKAVGHWKFQPGSMGNVLVESTVIVPIRFRLQK